MTTLTELGIEARIAQHELAPEIEELIEQWVNAPIFYASQDATVAMDLLGRTLWHTYTFARFTLTSYGAHVFSSLKDHPPVDEQTGNLIGRVINMLRGELLTNNIFKRPGEAHAHYHDMVEAYEHARGEISSVRAFEESEHEYGFDTAIKKSPLWQPAMIQYAQNLREQTKYRVTTSLIVTLSEIAIPRAYKTILDHLHDDPGFDKFRTFMRRHVELDTHEHGDVAIDWLNHHLSTQDPNEEHLDRIMAHCVRFLDNRIKTYQLE